MDNKGSVFYADGMLYCFGQKGVMALVEPSPSGLKVVSQFSVPKGGDGMRWAHPVVFDGRLYLRHSDRLYAYDVKGK